MSLFFISLQLAHSQMDVSRFQDPQNPQMYLRILFDLENMLAWEINNAPGDYFQQSLIFQYSTFLPQGTVIQLSDISGRYQEWDFHSHHQIIC